jgi:hypothetical protein
MMTIPFLEKFSGDNQASVVTVCWTTEGISVLRWFVPDAGSSRCLKWAQLDADACSVENYMEMFNAIIPPIRSANVPVLWILMQGKGVSTHEKKDLPQRFPEWMEAVWKGIPSSALPARILPGFACLEKALHDEAGCSRPGQGICFPIHGKWYFFGFSEEGFFRRVSRGVGNDHAACPALDEEWVQQTKMLYRGRTGVELKEIQLPGSAAHRRNLAGVIVMTDSRPAGWPLPADEATTVPQSLQFIHAIALQQSHGETLENVRVVEERRAERVLMSHFRMATALLFGGWLFLMLGACHSNEARPVDANRIQEEWSLEVDYWEDQHKRWREQSSRRREMARPFRFVGDVVASAPEGVDLERLFLSRRGGELGNALSIELEGSFEGDEASGVLRDWMQELRQQSSLAHVENLRFEKLGSGIQFHLEGRTLSTGGAK